MNHAHPHPAAVLKDLLNPAISILDMADKYRLTLTQLWRLIDSQPFHEQREAFQALSRTRTDIVDQDADARIRSALMSVAALPTDADRPTAESARLAASKLATYQRARRNQPAESPAPGATQPECPAHAPDDDGCPAYAQLKQDPPPPSVPQTPSSTSPAELDPPCPALTQRAKQDPPTPQNHAIEDAMQVPSPAPACSPSSEPQSPAPIPPVDIDPPCPAHAPDDDGCPAYAQRKQDPPPTPPETAPGAMQVPSSAPACSPSPPGAMLEPSPAPACPPSLRIPHEPPEIPPPLTHALRDTLATNLVAAAGQPHAPTPLPTHPPNHTPPLLPDPLNEIRALLTAANQHPP